MAVMGGITGLTGFEVIFGYMTSYSTYIHTYILYCIAPLGGSSVIHENKNNNNENYLHLDVNIERKKKIR